MKIHITFLVIIFLCASCKEANKDSKVENKTSEVVKKEAITTTTPKNSGTFLCKINGKDWSYTKASGIVSRHKKTNKRTAIITFTKQLDKGKEYIQLFYDGDTNALEKVTADIKQPKKGGGRMSAMYLIIYEGGKRLPDSSISGTIDLSDDTVASGTAEVLKMKIRFDEGDLEDETMGVISFSSLRFSGIGYSDSEKLFGSKSN